MRTFIAIPLPESCRVTLEKVQQPMRALGADVRWTSISSIHLTLKFRGEIEPSLVPDLAAAVRSIPANSFNLCIRGLGAFPDMHSPRVIWCGIEGDVRDLESLQARIESECEKLGFEREARAFRPHLTLGRVNGKRNLRPLVDYIRIGTGLESPFAADRVNLYKSDLTPRGAVYTILDSIVFQRQPPK